MPAPLMIAGAAMAGAGFLGGLFGDQPDDINIVYPEPSPMEQEISRLQLEAATALRDRIDDPRILQDIYSQLPATHMSAEDRARFTEEYSQIKQQVATVNLQQSGMAAGQRLDDMVDRGVMSQEAADRQRVKNEAAINAVTRIYNKKLDAARIGMARGQFLKEGQAGLRTGSAIADVDMTNRRIYNQVIGQALNNLNRRQGFATNMSAQQAGANLGTAINTSRTGMSFLADTLLAGADLYPAIHSHFDNYTDYEMPSTRDLYDRERR